MLIDDKQVFFEVDMNDGLDFRSVPDVVVIDFFRHLFPLDYLEHLGHIAQGVSEVDALGHRYRAVNCCRGVSCYRGVSPIVDCEHYEHCGLCPDPAI